MEIMEALLGNPGRTLLEETYQVIDVLAGRQRSALSRLVTVDEVLAMLVVPVLEDLPLVVRHVRVTTQVLALEDRRGHRRDGGPLDEGGQEEEEEGSGRHCVYLEMWLVTHGWLKSIRKHTENKCPPRHGT